MGNHGRTDCMHLKKLILDKQGFLDEITDCQKNLNEIYREANTEQPKVLTYRPGCGYFSSEMIKILKDNNLKLVLGSTYPHDPHVPIPIINFWYIKQHIESGDILILHDRTWTIPLLKMLIPWLKENNYKCVTVNELINTKSKIKN